MQNGSMHLFYLSTVNKLKYYVVKMETVLIQLYLEQMHSMARGFYFLNLSKLKFFQIISF